METTDWDKYGTGNYDKCSDCMAHCGYEASAVSDVFSSPIKAFKVALKGPKTQGEMAKKLIFQIPENLNLFSILMFRRCWMKFMVIKFNY